MVRLAAYLAAAAAQGTRFDRSGATHQEATPHAVGALADGCGSASYLDCCAERCGSRQLAVVYTDPFGNPADRPGGVLLKVTIYLAHHDH
jgi:hypothetical protein